MKWSIKLDNISLGGLAPNYWKSTYPSFGNKNQLAEITNCDLTNPNYITQGPALSPVTGTVDQLIKGILNFVASANKSYGVGETKLYEITPTAVSPKNVGTITGGEDVELYGGELLYSWDTNIGKTDLDFSSPDEYWWTTSAGGSALTSGKPHQMITAGTTGIMTVLNGSKVASWDGTTAKDTAFDTKDSDIELVSEVWNQNRFWFAGNKPNVSGRNEGSIFIWDGSSSSWETRIKISGKIGALYVKDGITFVIYQKNLSEGVCTLGYIDGIQIRDIANYKGSLPAYYQVSEYRDFLIWASGTDLMAWGSGGMNLPTRIFQLSACGIGGLANPFGTPITASSDKLEKFDGYTTTSSFKTLLFNTTGDDRKSVIDEIRINSNVLASGSEANIILKNSKGESLYTNSISYSDDGEITTKRLYPKCITENFSLEVNFNKGSSTNPFQIRNITIYGHTI